jgi:hypothetical protein
MDEEGLELNDLNQIYNDGVNLLSEHLNTLLINAKTSIRTNE